MLTLNLERFGDSGTNDQVPPLLLSITANGDWHKYNKSRELEVSIFRPKTSVPPFGIMKINFQDISLA